MLYEELIISSGGIYIVHYIGALISLNNYFPLENFKYYTGCSAGSLLCVLLVLNYNIEEIKNIIIEMDIPEYQDLKISNFIESYGFDNGEKFKHFFKTLLIKKGFHHNITFLELFERTHKILTLTVTNLTKQSAEYHNIFSTPYMKVLDSVLMSMNVPILFKPIKYTLTYMGQLNENNYYLDGGIIDPFPWKVIKKVGFGKKIGIFKDENNKKINVNNDNNNNEYMESMQTFFLQLIETVIKNFTKERYKFLKDEKISKNIFIIGNNLNSVDFSLSAEMKRNYIKKTEAEFDDFYFKMKRNTYLSKKYFYIWYHKSKNKK